jgi:gluconate 2-dehydrogenase subunit 3-like protein
MSDDVRDEPLPMPSDAVESSAVDGPLRTGVFGRRAVLQSLATGVGAAVLATPAAAHVHQAAAPAAAAKPVTPAARPAAAALVFFDRHAFDTIAVIGEQIVPGSRAAKVPEFLDRLLAVESTDTQKRVVQAIGAFERAAREAHGKPWKTLTAPQATAILAKMSEAPASDATRRAFETIKGGVAETYFATEAGLKELGWNRSVMFASPIACG